MGVAPFQYRSYQCWNSPARSPVFWPISNIAATNTFTGTGFATESVLGAVEHAASTEAPSTRAAAARRDTDQLGIADPPESRSAPAPFARAAHLPALARAAGGLLPLVALGAPLAPDPPRQGERHHGRGDQDEDADEIGG